MIKTTIQCHALKLPMVFTPLNVAEINLCVAAYV